MSGRSDAVLGGRRLLLLEVAVLEHARPPRRRGAASSRPSGPASAGERSAVTRFRVSFCSCSWPEVQRRHPLVQVGVGALALDLHVLEAPLVAGQGLAQRVQQLRDRLLALREVALGRRAGLVELGVGQREELLVVLGQRLAPTARRTSPPAGRAPPRPGAIASASDAPQQVELGQQRPPGPSPPPPPPPMPPSAAPPAAADDGLRVRQPALGEACCADAGGRCAPGTTQRRSPVRRRAR